MEVEEQLIPEALRASFQSTREKDLHERQRDILEAQGLAVEKRDFFEVHRCKQGTWTAGAAPIGQGGRSGPEPRAAASSSTPRSDRGRRSRAATPPRGGLLFGSP